MKANTFFLSLIFVLALNMEARAQMKITSPDFDNNGFIPDKFACDGADSNPTLVIEGMPETAVSLALIVEDPDAPSGTFTHWVLYDIAARDKITIRENSTFGKQGRNDFGRTRYGGPCPPSGVHRYFFKAYALRKEVGLQEGASKSAVERAMSGNVVESAELVGLYEKKEKEDEE